MAKSKINILVIYTPEYGDGFQIANNQITNSGDIIETFFTIREGSNQVAIGTSASHSANSLYHSLVADYGQNGLYNFTISGDTVTITSMVSNTVFTDEGTSAPFQLTIQNETEEPPIAIDSVGFSTNSQSPCDSIVVAVNTNVLATKYYVDGVQYNNSINPFTYILNRGVNKFLEVQAANLSTDNEYVKTPDVISPDNTAIGIVNSPNGATITATLAFNYLITAEYSLNSTTWQASNVFTGILPGNYTLYVRDQYGCLINKPFAVVAFAPVTDVDCNFSYISNSMSIRFKKNEEWNNEDIFKITNNTLSCEEQVAVPYRFIQQFKVSDIVKTQLLSNYTNISANIIKEDGTKDVIAITKKAQLLDIKDSRDCALFYLGNGKSGVYYTSGNTYDYTTGIANGTYALNGALPEYGAVGADINIVGIGWVRITDIIYDESLNADVLVFDYTYSGATVTKVVKCEYNQQNFNVYEFAIDFALYKDKYIQVEVLQSMEGFPDYNYISELLESRESYKDCLELIWYNNADMDVFYSTGIRNIANVNFNYFDLSTDAELVINKTYNTTVVVEARNYNVKELELDAVSTGVADKLVKALLHKHVFINRDSYVAAAEPTLEKIDSTNLYTLKCKMISSSPPYKTPSPPK